MRLNARFTIRETIGSIIDVVANYRESKNRQQRYLEILQKSSGERGNFYRLRFNAYSVADLTRCGLDRFPSTGGSLFRKQSGQISI